MYFHQPTTTCRFNGFYLNHSSHHSMPQNDLCATVVHIQLVGVQSAFSERPQQLNTNVVQVILIMVTQITPNLPGQQKTTSA